MTSATAGSAHHHDAYRESRLGSRRDGPALPASSFSASCTGPVLADVVLISRAPIDLVVVCAGVGMWWAMSVDVGSGGLVPGGVHCLEDDLGCGLPGQQTLHSRT